MKKKIFSILSFIITTSALSALSEQDESMVTIDFRAFLWPSHAPIAAMSNDPAKSSFMHLQGPGNQYTPPEVAYLENGKDRERTFQLLDDRLSAPLNYQGPVDLTFYQAGSPLSDPKTRNPIANLKIPRGARELTIFFFPKENGTYKLFPVDTSPGSIPAGSARIYNLSTAPLACKLDDSDFAIEPGKSHLTPFTLPSQHYQPILVASLSREGKWKRSLARKLIVNDEDRLLVIIYNLEANPDSYNLLRLVFRDEATPPEI